MRRPMAALALAVFILALVFVLTVNGNPRNGFDLSGSLIPADEIHLGGPPRDGIPSIDAPRFVTTLGNTDLGDVDRVLGLVVGGEARAYPIAIMNWHEVVNDRIAGQAVAITYCPLCGTGIAFAAEDGTGAMTFGVSGLLYNSDVLLYDRETESLWSQIRMQAISGQRKGDRLTALPLVHTSWAAWKAQNPQTLVLSRDTGFARDYDRDPYAGYANSASVYFPLTAESRRYHPKERVLGLALGGRFKAYPFAELARAGEAEFQDRFADRDLTIRFDTANGSASAFDEQGQMLPSVTGFWFAWYAFHPDTEVFTTSR